MFIKILLSLLIAAVLVILIWYARGAMLTPVIRGENQRLIMRLEISGKCPELESTVDGLLWLVANGTLAGDIHIVDAGMDDTAASVSELLEKRNHRVVFIRGAEKDAGDGQYARN